MAKKIGKYSVENGAGGFPLIEYGIALHNDGVTVLTREIALIQGIHINRDEAWEHARRLVNGANAA